MCDHTVSVSFKNKGSNQFKRTQGRFEAFVKIKEFLKKEPRLFQVYLLFLTCTLMCSIFRGAGNMDEIWNYTFANNIANGLLPYRDFNMLQTPLSAIIPGVVMAVTGSHLLMTRLLGAALHAGIATLMYRISKRLGGSVFVSLLPGCGFILLFVFNVFFEYSGLIVFLEVLLIDLDTQAVFRKNDSQVDQKPQENTDSIRFFLLSIVVQLSRQKSKIFIMN